MFCSQSKDFLCVLEFEKEVLPMTNGLGLFDSVLTLFLSNGMIVVAVVLLIAAIITLLANKKKRTPIKGICIALIICCIIYLAFILMLVIGFGSNAHPPVPS